MEEKILKDWFEAANKRDWNTLESLYTLDAVVHSKEGVLHGGSAVVGLMKKWIKALPDAKLTPLHVSTENDVVIVHWRSEGTLKDSIRDIAATGEKVSFHGLTCFRCQDNKVVEHWAAVDYLPLQPSTSTT